MTGRETLGFVLLEFPEESDGDANLSLLQNWRDKIQDICNEYCFKVGTLYILPRPYFPLIHDFLMKVKDDYHDRGYNPLFKILSVSLSWEEYKDLLRLILGRLRWRLEEWLKALEGKEVDERSLSDIYKETVKAKELILIFRLERIFPGEVVKLQDLIGILNERVSDLAPLQFSEVEVREI